MEQESAVKEVTPHRVTKDVGLKAEEICNSLMEQGISRLRNKARVYPCNSNRASTIGHPCHAHLYYSREAWQKKAPPSATLQSIFDVGSTWEPIIVQEIMQDCKDLGWGFVGQQQDFHDKELDITGHVDGIIVVDGVSYPLEIKTMNPQHWEKLNTAEDIKTSDSPWVEGYYGQIQAYLFLNSSEAGLFCFKNKATGLRKYIPVIMDWEYCDTLVKRVIRVNQARAKGEVPDKIMDEKYCDICDFRKVCLGEAERVLTEMSNEVLLKALQERQKNSQAASAYDRANEICKKEIAKAKEDEFKVGEFSVKRQLIPEKDIAYKMKAHFRNKIVYMR